MEEIQDQKQVAKTIKYDIPDSAVVFRMAWYTIASAPGVILAEYSEAESQIYKAKAIFSTKIADKKAEVRVWVEEAQTSAQISVFGEDESMITEYLDERAQVFESILDKYKDLDDTQRSKLKRALVAKTCWDKMVFEIISKAPAENVYVQLAHGREMIIKATEGDEELHPVSLTTSGWLQKIENLPRDKALPAEIATELAKKSPEWKKQTLQVIAQYL